MASRVISGDRTVEDIIDPGSYIILPQTNDHPDLFVSKSRLAYSSKVKKASETARIL